MMLDILLEKTKFEEFKRFLDSGDYKEAGKHWPSQALSSLIVNGIFGGSPSMVDGKKLSARRISFVYKAIHYLGQFTRENRIAINWPYVIQYTGGQMLSDLPPGFILKCTDAFTLSHLESRYLSEDKRSGVINMLPFTLTLTQQSFPSFDINTQDPDGINLLMYAAAGANFSVSHLASILDLGARVDCCSKENGKAIHLIPLDDDRWLLKKAILLIEHGADPFEAVSYKASKAQVIFYDAFHKMELKSFEHALSVYPAGNGSGHLALREYLARLKTSNAAMDAVRGDVDKQASKPKMRGM